MALLIALALAVVYVVLLNGLWEDLLPKEAKGLRKWLRDWTVKGLAVPFLVWLIFNSGLSSHFPPLMPQIDRARAGMPRLNVFLGVAAMGLFVIASYWMAVSTAWLGAILWNGSTRRDEVKQIAIGWSVLLVPAGGLICFFGGWGYAGLAISLWLYPILRSGFDLLRASKTPLYSRAIAKMQFDKYQEAETEVIAELEKYEDDFDGWMLLAELYANHFSDLPGAERLIRDSCEQPATTPSQLATAFHRLADWQLKIGSDPAAARRALEEICRRYPASHLAHMAQLRIDQLPANREELAEQRAAKPIPLPALSSALDIQSAADVAPLNRNQSAAKANQCVAKLNQNPNNTAAREELARIFTEQLNKVDLGIEQMELLLGMERQPEAKAAEWLALLGAWQIKYKNDMPAGRQTLERLVSKYPQSSQAFAAKRRLDLMEMEEKLRAARAAAEPIREIKLRI